MSFDDILELFLMSIKNNTLPNGFEYMQNKIDICDLSKDYVNLLSRLYNLVKIDYSSDSYYFHPVLILYINNYIRAKKKELDENSKELPEKLILDYKLVKKIFYEYGVKKKKDINVKMLYDNLNGLSEEELKSLSISKNEIKDLKSYLEECGNIFNEDLTFDTYNQNVLFLIIKRFINAIVKRNKYSNLKRYNLDVLLIDSIVEDDLCDLTANTYFNICGFVNNNKELFLKESVLNEINSKFDIFSYDEDLINMFSKLIEDKTAEKNIRNNKQRLTLMFNRMIIYNNIYKKYGIDAIIRADDINMLLFDHYYKLVASKLNLNDDYELEEDILLVQKIVKVDKTLPNIIFDNDYLSDNIISTDKLNLILDIFDPNSQFKDLTDIEIVNILLDIFICDDKTKFIDDNKYKNLSKEIKTIINKRNK